MTEDVIDVEPEEEPLEVSPEEADEILQAEKSVIASREVSVLTRPPSVIPVKGELDATEYMIMKLVDTPFVPAGMRGNHAAVLGAILYGREIGLPPMQALQKIYVIDGRVTMAADLMLAQMRKGGLMILDKESNDQRAWIKAKRTDTGEIGEVEWTVEEARAAGLEGKKNYRSYLRDMLWARCVGRLARQMGSDLLGGLVYATEEVVDWEDDYGYGGQPQDQKGVELRADAPKSWADIMTMLKGMDPSRDWLAWMKAWLKAITGAETREGLDDETLRKAAIHIANGVARLAAQHGGGFPPPSDEEIQDAFAHPDSVGEIVEPLLPEPSQDEPGEAETGAQAEGDAEPAPLASDAPVAPDESIGFGEPAHDDRSRAELSLDDEAAAAADRDT